MQIKTSSPHLATSDGTAPYPIEPASSQSTKPHAAPTLANVGNSSVASDSTGATTLVANVVNGDDANLEDSVNNKSEGGSQVDLFTSIPSQDVAQSTNGHPIQGRVESMQGTEKCEEKEDAKVLKLRSQGHRFPRL
ncbi:hypothetical protein XANCAGTX0491_010009 [Xanthoria calcicola]